jgi:hypothetical protein
MHDKRTRNAIYYSTLMGIAFFLIGQQVQAHTDGDLTVQQAWIAEAPPNAKVLAAYLEIQNHTSAEAKLIGVTSSAFDKVEIHRSEKKGEMVQMIKQDNVTIAANGKITFKPGGLHLMLIKPTKTIKAGDKIGLTLQFSNGKKVLATAEVKKRNSADNGHHHQHKHEHEHNH